GGTRLGLVKPFTVHGTDAGHQSIGRGRADQVIDTAPLALGSEGQRPVFDETVWIADGVYVLAGGALAELASSGDSFGARLIQANGMPLDHFGKIRSDRIQIDFSNGISRCSIHIRRLDEQERLI